MQVKLLRVLQERRFRRVGGTEEIESDIRVICATNRDLPKSVQEGRFREDLYYRINVIPVHLLPLRQRSEDIPLLADHFVRRFAYQMGKQIAGIAPDALAALEAYHWPGNIRELENAMERAVALERTPQVLRDSLPDLVREGGERAPALTVIGEMLPEQGIDLERHVQDIEREYIAQALRRAGGVKSKAADLLGMNFRSFRYYLKKYEIK
jgi:two-component system response regulator PilR (NtrC family)